MADRVRQLSQKTTRELGEVLAEHRRRNQGTTGSASEPNRNLLVPIRLAKTGTSERYPYYQPAYPSSDVMPVVFGQWQWFPDQYNDSGVAGNVASPEWIPYDPEESAVVWCRYGWIPEDQVVEVMWLHGRWHVMGDHWATRKAMTSTAISPGDSSSIHVWHNGAETDFQVEAYNNWMHNGTSIGASAEVIIRWFECEQKWIIIAAEC